jgi:PKD repeat protein
MESQGLPSGVIATPTFGYLQEQIFFSAPLSQTYPANSLTYAWNFDDGSTSSVAEPTHSFAKVGIYEVTVKVTNSSGTVASGAVTVTISAANPVITPDGSSEYEDTGYSLAVVNANSGVVPFGGIQAPKPQALTVSNLSVKLDFAKTGNDAIQLSGLLPIPAGFNPANQQVIVDVGGVAVAFTLNGKSQAKEGNDTFAVGIKAVKGTVAKQNAKFSAKLSKGTYTAALAYFGLTNSNANKAAHNVSVTVYFDLQVLQATQPVEYTAKYGKSGTASDPAK